MPFKDPKKKLAYRRKWYAENRESEKAHVFRRRKAIQKWFAEYKSKLKCTRCGENHPAVLDFHHKNPKEKEAGVNFMVYDGYSRNKILGEIGKCIVLCSNCHRKLHYGEDKKPYKPKK